MANSGVCVKAARIPVGKHRDPVLHSPLNRMTPSHADPDSRRVAFIVPAYEAARSIEPLVGALLREASRLPFTTTPAVIVVDDGSRDRTASLAERAGALCVRHPKNRGKGAALGTGLSKARELGARAAVSVDADGQHPAGEASRIACHPAPLGSLVLAVRDLARDGAPRASQFSNWFSNVWLSFFAERPLHDTQSGLRRYPLPETLDLGLWSTGFEFETEVILKAVRAGIEVAELPVRVHYPPPEERISHFRSARDPARIVIRLLHTAWTTPWRTRTR